MSASAAVTACAPLRERRRAPQRKAEAGGTHAERRVGERLALLLVLPSAGFERRRLALYGLRRKAEGSVMPVPAPAHSIVAYCDCGWEAPPVVEAGPWVEVGENRGVRPRD